MSGSDPDVIRGPSWCLLLPAAGAGREKYYNPPPFYVASRQTVKAAATHVRRAQMSAPACANAHVFPSELGWMALAWTDKGLARFTFGHPSAAAAIASLDADGDWTTTRAEALPK